MTKKYNFFIISTLALLFVLVGCQNNQTIPDGFYSYEKGEVKTAINELSFQPEIPSYVPIEVDFLISDRYFVKDTDMEALDVSFYTRNNDLLSVQFIDGNIDEEWIDTESVTLEDEITGIYVDNAFAKVLYWEKSGITYKMTYRSSTLMEEDNANNISKSDLVEVANSFQS
ncbi:hypothetical protein [Aquibacillus rhizosphaerae]|uniref:DUF4367 domain-containing protein n=1 Tax=Aquibacillus rhizosphaerae TaxID=3051431 RepID=A0ABT7L5E7_9BACI|nr:hypothetical protein [Aquibacillus sp. LR5S19]MDL4840412.1 hypothetical protein [Aquibacillus sp. LR5S19]